jgi:trans-2,3-dihydro-3-hydroxyanthranilate isomerase
MRQYRFLQYDVFTELPFMGNQLAVIPDAGGLTDGEMQAIAREMNYSETTFVSPATDIKAIRKVRIFTPETELPFAGHPTIGTTFALVNEKVVRSGDVLPIYLELGIGTIPIDLFFEGEQLSFVWMHQPVPEFAVWQGSREKLLESVGLGPQDLAPDLPIERGSAGVPFVYVPLRTTEALQRAQPGNAAMLRAALGEDNAHAGLYLFSCEFNQAAAGTPIVRTRMFGPALGVAEDAGTGSAAGPFAVYLLRHGITRPSRDGDVSIQIEQGVEMGRPCHLRSSLTCEEEAVRDVRVGGEAVLVAEGTIFVP